jgi:hypothetical protein
VANILDSLQGKCSDILPVSANSAMGITVTVSFAKAADEPSPLPFCARDEDDNDDETLAYITALQIFSRNIRIE